MQITGVNHMAFITDDMEKTIRFYRDLLGMELSAGVGHGGFRHYFFRFGDNHIAFFEYGGASPMERKFHGTMTDKPLGFDHVSFTVESREALFHFKDKLAAAGFEVTGAIDHGTIWSIYFFDPSNIPLELSWDCMELLKTPAMDEDDPLAMVAEGAGPTPGVWPGVTNPTPLAKMTARPGNGHTMRETFLREGLARDKPEYQAIAELSHQEVA
jgi:catechol 2,3-dioxygenase-like lactoylglutathione lyase family enzyme